MALLQSGGLELVVSDDPAVGFSMPGEDVVESGIRSAYTCTLYDDVDPSSLNTLERTVAGIIEQSDNVLWWVRNKVGHGWYAIQGWQRGKVRPDFIIARKNDASDALEFVYIVESKGEQLMGNLDTQYKAAVFERMQGARVRAAPAGGGTVVMRINDRFQFELLPQGEEERRLRAKL